MKFPESNLSQYRKLIKRDKERKLNTMVKYYEYKGTSYSIEVTLNAKAERSMDGKQRKSMIK